jgi:hypothetical protein
MKVIFVTVRMKPEYRDRILKGNGWGAGEETKVAGPPSPAPGAIPVDGG